jgi:hypothetical protein
MAGVVEGIFFGAVDEGPLEDVGHRIEDLGAAEHPSTDG